MDTHARTLALAERNDTSPKLFVMSRPIFALALAFVIGIAIGAITKD